MAIILFLQVFYWGGINGAAQNEDGVLTANSLMHYVYNKVGTSPSSDQTPHYGHIQGDGDFILWTPNQAHLSHDTTTDFLINVAEASVETATQPTPDTVKPYFAIQCGYDDPRRPTFGHNEYSAKLGECRADHQSRSIERAYSWFGLTIGPVANVPLLLDIRSMASNPNAIYRQGNEPFEKFSFPNENRTTSDSLLLYHSYSNTNWWSRYLRITKYGCFEYAETRNTFFEYKEVRIFKFINIMGMTWQFINLSKQLLAESWYNSGLYFTFNIVGTKGSILGNFSKERGANNQIWRDPLTDPFGFDHGQRDQCDDRNLQVLQEFTVRSIDYNHSFQIIESISEYIELAYNHHEDPRCFNVGTKIFPWDQFMSGGFLRL